MLSLCSWSGNGNGQTFLILGLLPSGLIRALGDFVQSNLGSVKNFQAPNISKLSSRYLLDTLFNRYLYNDLDLAGPFFCHLLRIETLDKCFSHDTVEEIIDSLVRIFFSLPASREISFCFIFPKQLGSQ